MHKNGVCPYDTKPECNNSLITASKTVYPTELKITVYPENLFVGDTYNFETEVVPKNAVNKDITYKSRNTDILEVSSSGILIAKKNGVATITCTTSNNISKTFSVKITNVEALSVNITDNALELFIDDTYCLNYVIEPARVTEQNVVWRSSNDAVVSVDSKGRVVAKDIGEAIISITTTNQKTDNIKIVVNPISAETLTIFLDNKKVDNIKIGIDKELLLIAEISPSNTTDKNINWQIDDKSVLRVLDSKKLPIKPGTTKLTATI